MIDKIIEQKKRLEKSEEFKKFIQEHENSFFISAFLTKDFWELHYFCPDEKKAGCFSMGEKIGYLFSEMTTEGKLNELKLEKINYDLSDENLLKLKKKYLESDIMNQIISLQNFKSKFVWNITWLTSSLNLINLKISTNDGKIVDEKKENVMSWRH